MNPLSSFENDVNVGERCLEPLQPFPLSQSHKGYLYMKKQTIRLPWSDIPRSRIGTVRERYGDLLPSNLFPIWRGVASLKLIEVGGREKVKDCEVFAIRDALSPSSHHQLRTQLDVIATETNDFPFPMYQNIIDPNMLAHAITLHDSAPDQHHSSRAGTTRYQWTPSLFEAEELAPVEAIYTLQSCAFHLTAHKLPTSAIRSVRSYLGTDVIARCRLLSRVHSYDPSCKALLHIHIEELLQTALPLLSKLRRPAMLLPGLAQVVVKAQRIYLKPGEEYNGIWHLDGLHEHVVAVVLYYYRCDPTLTGGQLEFVDKQGSVFGICGDYPHDPFEQEDMKDFVESLPHCKVDVTEGTMIVFSNYQLVHRVLRMKNESRFDVACRDFVALFILDQQHPLASTKDMFSADHSDTKEQEVSFLVREEERQRVRSDLLTEQLKPSGKFGISSDAVYSCGNGCVGQLGWTTGDVDDFQSLRAHVDIPRSALEQLAAMNWSPPLGRGVSYATDPQSVGLLNPFSPWMEVRRVGQDGEVVEFLNISPYQVVRERPWEGVCAISD
jgi:hypothetical protein